MLLISVPTTVKIKDGLVMIRNSTKHEWIINPSNNVLLGEDYVLVDDGPTMAEIREAISQIKVNFNVTIF